MVWLGSIYLREEGGYEIIIKSLVHYKKRLKAIGKSPELRDSAAMFATVLHQQAGKTIPEIDSVISRIYNGLGDRRLADNLADDIAFMDKALQCHKADIHKAEDTGHEYFVELVGGTDATGKRIKEIEVAQQKLKIFE